MPKNWSTFKLPLLVAVLLTALPSARAQSDSTRYAHRAEHYRSRWDALIPTQLVVQNAGNMGLFSLGTGWNYGKHRQWETHILFGYIPKYKSPRGKLTNTLKQNYLPWTLVSAHGWHFRPLTATIYLNTVYGHEFWRSQPSRYPDKYYEFMSTKFRLNVGLGQQLTKVIPDNRRKFCKSISLFYEVSSCDLYLRSLWVDRKVKPKDVFGLSLGLKLQML